MFQFNLSPIGLYTQSAIANICNTTGTEEQNITNKMTVYPNPFSNRIQIENTTGLEDYKLINSLGQTVWMGKNINQQDFSNLSNGLYVLHVSKLNGQQTIKLIKY
jgi:hypothetical protein